MHINFPKKFYFINSFKKNNIDKLNNNTGVIYRNYKNSINLKEIINIKNYCKRKNIKFFISNHFKLAVKLKLDGAYIPSFNRDFRHLGYKVNSSFLIIGSAHNINDIRIKERQKVKLIFLSSIFKKNKNYLGLYRFRYLKKMTRNEIVPLGGINKNNLKKLGLLDCKKMSGISYFE